MRQWDFGVRGEVVGLSASGGGEPPFFSGHHGTTTLHHTVATGVTFPLPLMQRSSRENTVSSPLSMQLYTVRDALALDPAGTLARLVELGFTRVELFGMTDRADEYAALLPAAGLLPSSAHASVVGHDLNRVLAAAQRLGVGTVIEPAVPAERWQDRSEVLRIADELNAAAASAAGSGVAIGYHNHWWEFETNFDGDSAYEVFAAHLDPAVVLELDTYWSTVGGVPAVGLLERLGSRVGFIHVKDGDVSRDNKRQVAVGSGRMPVTEILAAAPGAVRVVELDDFDGDVFDALADSIGFLVAQGEHL